MLATLLRGGAALVLLEHGARALDDRRCPRDVFVDEHPRSPAVDLKQPPAAVLEDEREHDEGIEAERAQDLRLALVDLGLEERGHPGLTKLDYRLREREVGEQIAAPELERLPVERVLGEVDEELAHHAREVAPVCLEFGRQEHARRSEDAGDRRLTLERLRRGESHGRGIDASAGRLYADRWRTGLEPATTGTTTRGSTN
jgi:hypothetical protein